LTAQPVSYQTVFGYGFEAKALLCLLSTPQHLHKLTGLRCCHVSGAAAIVVAGFVVARCLLNMTTLHVLLARQVI
jgi:hypothetical protein